MSLVAQIEAAGKAASHFNRNKGTDDAKLERWKAIAQKGREQHTQEAIDRYSKVIFSETWSTQAQIEQRLGYASTVSTPFLRKLEKMGFIEKQNRDGAKVYNRKRGYEYRWVKGACDE
jgi:ribosomal protein S25